MTGRSLRLRIAATVGFLATVFAVLAGGAVQLTVVDGAGLRRLAARQHKTSLPLAPKRGEIVDRHGEALALTRESAAVYVRPRELTAGPETLSMVARLLGMPSSVVAAKAASKSPFVWLSRQVPLDSWSLIADLGIPGIGSEPTRVRYYPHGTLAGHVLGFTNIDGKGLEGVERVLDADLRGEVEALDVERDARGRRMVVDGLWRPLPRVGSRVELTIDAGIQRVAEAELRKAVDQYQAKAATAVVLDPRTGEVLALANVPEFDPNAFAQSSADIWRNRAVTDSYEPGSTFKAILAAAALEAGVVTPSDPVYCEGGSYAVGRRVIHDSHPQGLLTFAGVIQKSSNIGSAKVAERLGRERFGTIIERIGFGRNTGIDLPGEVPGLLRPVDRWGRIHLVTTAFGQGIAVTPIQLTSAFAAIANEGLLMRPYVVRRVRTEDGVGTYVGQPRMRARVVSPETARKLSDILVGVVEGGTGTQAKIEGFRVAGKTGTAQKVDPGSGRYSARDRMSSFVGFVPADDPRLAILVVVDTPRKATYGGVVAAPAFRQIAEYALDKLRIRPPAQPAATPASVADVAKLQPVSVSETEAGLGEASEHSEGKVPNLVGMSMREAIVRARRAGFTVRVEGTGYVVAQIPAPGEDRTDTQLALRLGGDAS